MEAITTIVRWVLMTAGVVMPMFLAYVFVRLIYLRRVDPKRHEPPSSAKLPRMLHDEGQEKRC